MGFPTQIRHGGVIGSFLTGPAVLAPPILAPTRRQCIMARLAGAFGPGALAGALPVCAGSALKGQNHGVAACVPGRLAVLAGVRALGVPVRRRARKGIEGRLEALFSRLPFLRVNDRPVAQVFGLVAGGSGDTITAMRVGVARFGGATVGGPAGGAKPIGAAKA
jgi:hypothetical protein